MIETIGTYAELPYPPGDVEGWLLDNDDTWNVQTSSRTGALTGNLMGAHTSLGYVRISRNRDEDSAAAYAVKAEGNLLTLLHGQAGKHLTLRDEHVGDAVDAYRVVLAQSCPLAPPRQRLIRVDASVTWRRSDRDALRQMQEGIKALHLAKSGRRTVASYAGDGASLQTTKKIKDRIYDKTTETIAGAKKARVQPPDLGTGRLIRFERQMTRDTCRKHYGDDLQALTELGAPMARIAVTKATDTYAAQDTHGTPDHLYARLIALGATPPQAAALMGPALLLARGGVPALTRFGMSDSTAYRLRARIRSLYGEDQDEGDVYAEHEEEREHDADEHQPNLWDINDAEWAG